MSLFANTITEVPFWRRRDMVYVLQQPCVNPGDECTEVITILIIDPFSITDSNDGGRDLHIKLGTISTEANPDDSNVPDYNYQSNTASYTIPVGVTFTIETCEDKDLEGTILSVGGMTTDANGYIHYHIAN